MPNGPVITFFTRPDCSLCDAALFVLRRVRAAHPFELAVVNIDEPGQESWHAAYRHDIPVVHLNGVEIFRHRIDERCLRAILREGR